MKKLLLLSGLLLSALFASAQCELIDNWDFENVSCSDPALMFSNDCAGQNWGCFNNTPTLELTVNMNFMPLGPTGSAYALLVPSTATNTNPTSDMIFYNPISADLISEGLYDMSFDFASLIDSDGESDPGGIMIFAVEPNDLNPTCPIGSMTLDDINNLDSKVLFFRKINAGVWVHIEEEVLITVPNNASGNVALIIASFSGNKPASMGFDNFCITPVECEPTCTVENNLTSCSTSNSTGYVRVSCDNIVSFSWDFPAGSTADVVDGQGESILVNASPGVYVLTTIDEDGCSYKQEFEIIETCCEVPPYACDAPENLSCQVGKGNVVLSWDPVLLANSYEIQVKFNDQECGCSGLFGLTYDYFSTTNQVSIPVSQSTCFSWKVKSICSEGMRSDFSAPMCYKHFQCFPRTKGLVSDMHEDLLIDKATASPILFPNPTKEEINFKIELKEKGDVQVNMIDINGKLIQRFDFGEVQAGTFSTVLEPRTKLPAGTYFIQTMIGETHFQNKLIITD